MSSYINNLQKQFAFEPKLENAQSFIRCEHFLVLGMGGSHLAADVIQMRKPEMLIDVHSDYGLPPISLDALEKRTIVACSHSGNTEEVLDGFGEALHKKLHLVAVATGGELLKRAKSSGVPHIALPEVGLQPRFGIGYMIRALLEIFGEIELIAELEALSTTFAPAVYSDKGTELAERLYKRIPLVYVSERNRALAYNWKIRFNEIAKIPAFMNVVPEANHNEMQGFDTTAGTKALNEQFTAVFLGDNSDDLRVIHRMNLMADIYRSRNIPVEFVQFNGAKGFQKIFASIVLADWTSFALAKRYGVSPEEVPLIEEFKRQLRKEEL